MQRIWFNSPCLRLLLPLVAGILLQINFELSQLVWLSLLLISLSCFLAVHIFISSVRYDYRFLPGVSMSFLFITLGGMLSCVKPTIHSHLHYSRHYIAGDGILLKLKEAPEEKVKSYKTVAEVCAIVHNGLHEPTCGDILLYLERDSAASALEVDDIVMVKSNISALNEVQNPFEFNYKKYLNWHFIYNQLYASSDNWQLIVKPERHSFRGLLIHWREQLLKQLRRYGIEGQEYAVLAALILGKTDAIDFDLMSNYASAGAIHVLAVSGLHVGLIYVLLTPVLRLVFPGKKRKFLKFFIPALFLWLYAGITGFSPSVLRAAVMFTFFIIAEAYSKKSSVYNTISASALILLCWNPYMIMEVGFQLSYLAVLGIVILQRPISALWPVSNKWLNKIWQLMAVSFAAQLATFPLGMLYFHQFPNYFLVSNLIVIPLSTIILYISLSFLALCWWNPVAQCLAQLMSCLTKVMNSIVSWFDALPYSIVQGISLSVFETYMLFAIVWCGCRWLLWKKSKSLIWLTSFVALLCISQVIEKTAIVQFREICLHNIPGHICITYCKGEEGYIFYDKNLMSQESRIRFHLRNYWNHLGIKDFYYIAIDSSQTFEKEEVYFSYPYIQIADFSLAITDEKNLRLATLPEADHLIMGKVASHVNFTYSTMAILSTWNILLTKDYRQTKENFLRRNLPSPAKIYSLRNGALIWRNKKLTKHNEIY